MAQVVRSRDREWVAGLVCRSRVGFWGLGPILVPFLMTTICMVNMENVMAKNMTNVMKTGFV